VQSEEASYWRGNCAQNILEMLGPDPDPKMIITHPQSRRHEDRRVEREMSFFMLEKFSQK
jgi:hypothetical protein